MAWWETSSVQFDRVIECTIQAFMSAQASLLELIRPLHKAARDFNASSTLQEHLVSPLNPSAMILVISALQSRGLFSLAQILRTSLHQQPNYLVRRSKLQYMLVHRQGLAEVHDTLVVILAADLILCSCTAKFVGREAGSVHELNNDFGSQGVFAHYTMLA